jgi:hypothetical protein
LVAAISKLLTTNRRRSCLLPTRLGRHSIHGSSDADDLFRIREAKLLGMHVVLDVGRSFFSGVTLDPSYKSKWSAYAQQIAPYVDDGTIVAFYPIDEPYGAAFNGTISYGQMLSQLDTVGTTVKASFPTAKLAMVFTVNDFPTLAKSNIIPHSFDSIGFDCYGSWSSLLVLSIGRRDDQGLSAAPKVRSALPSHSAGVTS